MDDATKDVAQALGQAFTPTHLARAAKMMLMQNEVPGQLLWQDNSTKQIWLGGFAALVITLYNINDWPALENKWVEVFQPKKEDDLVKDILATMIDEHQKDAAKKLYDFLSKTNTLTRRFTLLEILFAATKISVAKRREGLEYLDR